MEEWLKKLVAGWGQQPLRSVPFDQAASSQMKDALDKVHLRFMLEPEGSLVQRKPIPAIHVFKPTGINVPGAFYLPENAQGAPSGVYLAEDYLKRLSVPEALSMVLHEYGHHYGNHHARGQQVQAKEGLNSVFTRFRRSVECEADHFSAYYFPEEYGAVSGHFSYALAKFRGGNTIETTTPDGSYHPPDLQRVHRLADAVLKHYPPGSIRLNDRCNIVQVPATPAPPDSDAGRPQNAR